MLGQREIITVMCVALDIISETLYIAMREQNLYLWILAISKVEDQKIFFFSSTDSPPK